MIVIPAKQTAEPIEMPFGLSTRVGSRKHVLDGRNLANTIKLSMCCGYAALLSNFYDHLLLLLGLLLLL